MIALRGHLASLTSRLVLTTVILILVVTSLIAIATTVAMRSYLTDQLDHRVQELLQPGGGGPGRGSEPGTLAGVFPKSGTPYGSVAESDHDQPAALEDEAVETLADIPSDGHVHGANIPDLGSYRVAAQEFPEGTVVIGLPTDDIDDALSTLFWLEALFALLAVVAGGGVALVVVRRQLRPLREVAATAHTVAELPLSEGDFDLTERVPGHLTDERTEVGQVGAALNTLLEHVETSLAERHRSEQQVRQFVADASHELRSPLATIVGYTELARRRPDDTSVASTALDKVEEEAGRMTSLVEDLLLLARLDSGRPLERRPVDLTRLLLEAVSDARVLSPGHRWRLDVPDDAVDTPYEIIGDELRLHQVVTNLLTNARKHTPPGTTVTVRVRRDGFAVHDDGPGFPPGLVEHAFERFARGDAARTRGTEVGVGLGLALVEAIVTSHGGGVSLASTPGDTTVDVRLPR